MRVLSLIQTKHTFLIRKNKLFNNRSNFMKILYDDCKIKRNIITKYILKKLGW